MKDPREHHEITWTLLLLIAIELAPTPWAAVGLYAVLLMVLVQMTSRIVRRWRRRRRKPPILSAREGL